MTGEKKQRIRMILSEGINEKKIEFYGLMSGNVSIESDII